MRFNNIVQINTIINIIYLGICCEIIQIKLNLIKIK